MKSLFRSLYYTCVRQLPPRLHATLDYFRVHRRFPNLKDPQTLNEKIVWRKLYERDPRLPDLVDKIKVKEYISSRFGEELVIPTLAVYKQPEEMDFSDVPLSEPPYVIKTNHGAAMCIFVLEWQTIGSEGNIKSIRRRLRRWLATDYSKQLQEWAYSKIERKILVEPYVGSMADYKFHVFHGKVFGCEVIVDRFTKNRQDAIYSRDWNFMCTCAEYPPYTGPLASEEMRERMIEIAELIGKDFSYVRVDLYEVNGAPKFGELTFYPGGRSDKFFAPRVGPDVWSTMVITWPCGPVPSRCRGRPSDRARVDVNNVAGDSSQEFVLILQAHSNAVQRTRSV